MTDKIQNILQTIKDNYHFYNDEQIATLLESLADSRFKGVTYWDYIEVDTLLSLQKPKTNYPDEIIFIVYHQICELYFKLIIQELKKITKDKNNSNNESDSIQKLWNKSLNRISRYFVKLIASFDILKFGMETSQFNKFRKALLPASGFQTYQFRLIEIMLTPFENLIKKEIRDNLSKPITIEKHYNNIYWRSGAIDKATNEPTKVLINFNKKYDKKFKKILTEFHNKNIYSRYLNSDLSFQKKVKIAMKDVENNILLWKIAHLRAVERYIHSSLSGTGGTKWDDYLPVLKQKILYFPDFWIGNDFESEIQKLISDFPEKIKNEIKELFSENS